jgi:hypothetical protein
VDGLVGPAGGIPDYDQASALHSVGGVIRLLVRHGPQAAARHAGHAAVPAGAGYFAGPSRRRMDTARADIVRSRFLHYSVAVRHLRVPLSELVRLMGPVSAREDAAWTRTTRPVWLRRAWLISQSSCAMLTAALPRRAVRVCPLLRPQRRSCGATRRRYSARLPWTHRRSAGPRWFVGRTCRPRRQFFGTCSLWARGPRGGMLVGSLSTKRGALAFEAFVLAVDVRGRYCFLRNDAAL